MVMFCLLKLNSSISDLLTVLFELFGLQAFFQGRNSAENLKAFFPNTVRQQKSEEYEGCEFHFSSFKEKISKQGVCQEWIHK